MLQTNCTSKLYKQTVQTTHKSQPKRFPFRLALKSEASRYFRWQNTWPGPLIHGKAAAADRELVTLTIFRVVTVDISWWVPNLVIFQDYYVFIVVFGGLVCGVNCCYRQSKSHHHAMFLQEEEGTGMEDSEAHPHTLFLMFLTQGVLEGDNFLNWATVPKQYLQKNC